MAVDPNPADTPLLLIAWRRPHTLRQVIDAIRPVAPTRLFVACDGPNPERPGEAEKVAATRQVIEQEIDWPCQIERLYSDENQGCRLGVSRAITWFFEQVEEGIILEDDCVPHPDFFPYCTTLLERYRRDTRVWCISGNNFQNCQWRGDGSYYFSRYNHCWGWASWRRCWDHYDGELSQWPALRDSGLLETIFEDPLERNYWSGIWQRLQDTGEPDTWDYRWTFTCLANGGLTALPNRNLVSNVGFGEDATHTTTGASPTSVEQGILPIAQPSFILQDQLADSYFVRTHLLSMPKPALARIRGKIACAKRKVYSCFAVSRIANTLPADPPHIISSKQARSLSAEVRYQHGELTAITGHLLRYADACTLVAGHDEIYGDCVYDFHSDTASPLIVDCGANIGIASLWFASRFPKANIIAYEADPVIFGILKDNIKSFNLSDRVSANNLAVWTHNSGVEFDQEGGFSGQVSSHGHQLVKAKISVPSISLQCLIDNHEQIDLLKIDIEGAENQIFTNGLRLDSVQRVFLEYHSHENDPQLLHSILGLLSNEGFRYHIKEANPSPRPFVEVKALLGMDLQLNIYAYRP